MWVDRQDCPKPQLSIDMVFHERVQLWWAGDLHVQDVSLLEEAMLDWNSSMESLVRVVVPMSLLNLRLSPTSKRHHPVNGEVLQLSAAACA